MIGLVIDLITNPKVLLLAGVASGFIGLLITIRFLSRRIQGLTADVALAEDRVREATLIAEAKGLEAETTRDLAEQIGAIDADPAGALNDMFSDQ